MLGLAPAVPGVGELVVGPVAARLVGSAGADGGGARWGAELCRGGVSAVPTVSPTRDGPTPRAGHHSLTSGPRHLEFQEGIRFGKNFG